MLHLGHAVLLTVGYLAAVFVASRLWSGWVTAEATRAVRRGRRSNTASDTAPILAALLMFSAVLLGLLLFRVR